MKSLLTILIVLCSIPCSALRYDFKVGGIYYLITDSIKEMTVLATSNMKSLLKEEGPYNGDVVIPSSVEWNNKSYKVIGLFATFTNCSDLVSVKLPYGLESIDTYSFANSGLSSIEIPNSVTYIGDRAFTNTKLTSVVIPESVKEILFAAFNLNQELIDVELPQELNVIAAGLFAGCPKLEEIRIPDSVSKIGGRAFIECRNLRKIKLPQKLISIEEEAFESCSELSSIEIPQSVREIGDATFAGCYNLKSVKIPEGVMSIRYLTFLDCHSLTSVSLPKTLTLIGESAFEGCKSLNSIEIPANVTRILIDAFKDVPLTCVKLGWTSPKYFDHAVFPNPENIELYVPAGSEYLYRQADYWKSFKKIVSY